MPESDVATRKPGGGFSHGALHVRMLEEYAPASAIVDDRLDVVHLSAHAGSFLRPNGGEPSTSVLDLTGGELRRVLRTALHQAIRRGGRIFERFWQLDGATTRTAGGMGIGLAAAPGCARLLKGDVEVESIPGKGSTFRLWLPVDYGSE